MKALVFRRLTNESAYINLDDNLVSLEAQNDLIVGVRATLTRLKHEEELAAALALRIKLISRAQDLAGKAENALKSLQFSQAADLFEQALHIHPDSNGSGIEGNKEDEKKQLEKTQKLPPEHVISPSSSSSSSSSTPLTTASTFSSEATNSSSMTTSVSLERWKAGLAAAEQGMTMKSLETEGGILVSMRRFSEAKEVLEQAVDLIRQVHLLQPQHDTSNNVSSAKNNSVDLSGSSTSSTSSKSRGSDGPSRDTASTETTADSQRSEASEPGLDNNDTSDDISSISPAVSIIPVPLLTEKDTRGLTTLLAQANTGLQVQASVDQMISKARHTRSVSMAFNLVADATELDPGHDLTVIKQQVLDSSRFLLSERFPVGQFFVNHFIHYYYPLNINP